MYKVLFVFMLFIIYSFIGWIVDIIGYFLERKTFSNRGFLIGPYCPIYGVASIFMLFFLDKYKDDYIVLFSMAVIVCSFIEYFTSYIMEKLFHARWWDYSKIPFNLNGRVCLPYSIMFGVLALLLVEYINPLVTNFLLSLNSVFLMVVSGILLVVFIVDFSISFNIIHKLKVTADNIKKDRTDEITAMVRDTLSKQSILFRRLLSAFPNFVALGKKVFKK